MLRHRRSRGRSMRTNDINGGAPARNSAPALRPTEVAARWQCSAKHVRNLCKAGPLRHFYLGNKLLRIPNDAVEEYERCQKPHVSDSASIGESGPQSGTKKAADTAARRARRTVVSRKD